MSKTKDNFIKCSQCNELKGLLQFSTRVRSPTGRSTRCKGCVEAARRSKGKVSKEEALRWHTQLIEEGGTYLCKCCGISKTADKFYTVRDYGKVRLATGRCSTCQISYQRFKSFGVTEEEYQDMLKSQRSCCAICEVPITEYAKEGDTSNFAVDHDHTTGKVRGLLCNRCNRGLGYFKDSINNLKRALNYIS